MAALNRLAELQSGEPSTAAEVEIPRTQQSTNADIAQHMRLYEPIKEGLEKIGRAVQEVETLKAKDRVAANDKGRKEIIIKLEQIMAETTKEGAMIKAQLDNIKKQNEAFSKDHADSAKTQMRVNLYQTHIRRFHQVMTDYNAASHEFKQHLQDTVRRQLRIVNKDLQEDEIDKIVESGRAPDVIKQVLISDDVKDIVNDIEERHLDILKLEAQVLEVYELFRDLATLVDLQQESLDVIENRVANAKAYAEKAEVELITAEKYQKKARKRKCCILLILVGALAAILAPVLTRVLRSS